MSYQRLTPTERYQIEALSKSRYSIRAIAHEINRQPSTVLRELKRLKEYNASSAQLQSLKLASSRRAEKFKIKTSVRKKIRYRLENNLSPEQIASQLDISQQSIYRFIHRDKLDGGKLFKNLRLLKFRGKDRKLKTWKPRLLHQTPRLMISDRPKVVEKRRRLGDLERDTVHGTLGRASLLTIVDRTSRLVRIKKISNSTNHLVHEATLELLKNEKVRTITNDNGPEFRKYKPTAEKLKVKIYFTNAYRSWERGTNENMNGLIRQYFPRKKDLSHFTDKEIKRVERKLNNRPRKCLGFKTPLQVHRELKRRSAR